MIWYFPANNCLFRDSNWSTKVRCENCSRLKMKKLEQSQWRHYGVLVVNCEHISHFVLIAYFEQANVCWVYTGKINFTLQRFKCEQIFLPDGIWAYTIKTRINQWGILAKEFTLDIDSGYKNAAHIQNDLVVHLLLYIFCWKTN